MPRPDTFPMFASAAAVLAACEKNKTYMAGSLRVDVYGLGLNFRKAALDGGATILRFGRTSPSHRTNYE